MSLSPCHLIVLINVPLSPTGIQLLQVLKFIFLRFSLQKISISDRMYISLGQTLKLWVDFQLLSCKVL